MISPIREAQGLLMQWRARLSITSTPPGYYGARDVDGLMGPRTRAAVATFQRAWNAGGEMQLRTDGTIDGATLTALRRDCERMGIRVTWGEDAGDVDALGWSEADYRALGDAAAQLVARPADLLLVLFSESRLQPTAAYRDSKGFPVAVGLNQITPVNAKAMGISETERQGLLKLAAAEQLPYVVRSFHAAAGKRSFRDAGMLYQVNFAPGTLAKGSGDGVVMYRKGDGPAYDWNAGLDIGHKGTITVGDLRTVLRGHLGKADFKAALARLKSTVPGTVDPVVSGDAPAPGAPTGGGIADAAPVALVLLALKFGGLF